MGAIDFNLGVFCADDVKRPAARHGYISTASTLASSSSSCLLGSSRRLIVGRKEGKRHETESLTEEVARRQPAALVIRPSLSVCLLINSIK